MSVPSHNQAAIDVLNKHIDKLENNLKALVAVLEFDHLERLISLRLELKAKIEKNKSGELSQDDLSEWLSAAANTEKECINNLNSKLVGKRWDRRFKLESELESVRNSVWVLSR